METVVVAALVGVIALSIGTLFSPGYRAYLKRESAIGRRQRAHLRDSRNDRRAKSLLTSGPDDWIAEAERKFDERK